MTSQSEFAGVPTLCDASPALPPPAQVTATSGLTVPPPGQPALSLRDGYYTDQSRKCAFCGDMFFRFSKTSPDVWARRISCSAKKCVSIRESMRQRRIARAGSGKPKDMGREAILFAGLSFTDDRRQAAKQETRFTKLPEPSQSLTGSHGQMCASARRT